jgi:hypothetical protein
MLIMRFRDVDQVASLATNCYGYGIEVVILSDSFKVSTDIRNACCLLYSSNLYNREINVCAMKGYLLSPPHAPIRAHMQIILSRALEVKYMQINDSWVIQNLMPREQYENFLERMQDGSSGLFNSLLADYSAR